MIAMLHEVAEFPQPRPATTMLAGRITGLAFQGKNARVLCAALACGNAGDNAKRFRVNVTKYIEFNDLVPDRIAAR